MIKEEVECEVAISDWRKSDGVIRLSQNDGEVWMSIRQIGMNVYMSLTTHEAQALRDGLTEILRANGVES